MMQLNVKKGSTDRSVYLYIIDATAGTPEQGVNYATSGLALWYRRVGAAATAITPAELVALTTAHTDGGIIHIDDGLYRVDVPDAAFATGVSEVVVGGFVTDMIVLPCVVALVNYDPEDGVRLGLTALPNAAADAAGGLPISDAGALDLDAKLANTNEVTAARMGALTDWINGGRLDLILDAINTSAARLTLARGNALDLIGPMDVALAALPSATDIEDAVLDEVVEGTLTLRQILRILLSALAGEVSGAPSGPIAFRDNADSKNRITATIDADGNRTAVTLDGA